MTPVVVSFCVGTGVGISELNRIGIDNFAELSADEQMQLMQNAALNFMDSFSLIALLILVAAIVIALYLVLSSPIGAPVAQAAAFPAGPVGPVSQVMTPAEAARYLRVSETDVRALIDEGRLAAAKIGGDYRIARRAVDDFLSESMEPKPARSDDPFADI